MRRSAATAELERPCMGYIHLANAKPVDVSGKQGAPAKLQWDAAWGNTTSRGF